MKLTLVRHGLACHPAQDPFRPLTEAGILESTAQAQWACDADLDVKQIWHSSKLRAIQTAAIFAEALSPPAGVCEKPFLLPESSASIVVSELMPVEHNLMIVSHLPLLPILFQSLYRGQSQSDYFFAESSCAHLERDNDGRWKVCFFKHIPNAGDYVT